MRVVLTLEREERNLEGDREDTRQRAGKEEGEQGLKVRGQRGAFRGRRSDVS